MSSATLRHRVSLRAGLILMSLAAIEEACASSAEPPGASGPSPRKEHTPATRGIELISPAGEDGAAPVFDPAQSAGLFIGVRHFRKHGEEEVFPEVPFAVDDAVDLAYLFSVELDLVTPDRVTVLLSGEPQKKESRRQLDELLEEDAKVSAAGRSEILEELTTQAGRVGPEGVLVVTLAGHGVREEGVDYFLTTDSIEPFLGLTSIDTQTLFRVLDEANTERKIVLLDTCRRALQKQGRSPRDPRFVMSRELAQAIATSQGTVILSAARSGGNAWDDSERGNGVFSAAVLDGLRCQAGMDPQGRVTAGRLADFVNRRVIAWCRRNRPLDRALCGIEYVLGGPAGEMILVNCGPPPPDCRQVEIERVEVHIGQDEPRVVVPPQNRISFTSREVQAAQNLMVRAVLAGPREALQQCRCQWQEPKGAAGAPEFQDGTADACAVSVAPPTPFSKVTLQLQLGREVHPPITIDVQ